jgi:lipopolysaccharide biosynthesis regulator YciM
VQVVDATSGAVVLSNAEKKMITIIQKQDRMLYLCFFMLLNLAERDTVERKMTRKNIVSYLVEMLSRSNVEVLILAVTFLKKLSIYKENKDQMIKVRATYQCRCCGFQSPALRLSHLEHTV